MEEGLLRICHIASGVLWAGTAMFLGWFLVPAVQEAGPSGGAVMGSLMRRGLSTGLTVVSGLCILTGARLYALVFATTGLATPVGLVFLTGGLLALAALLLGFLVNRPTAVRLAELGGVIRAGGGPPTAEQTAALAALHRKMAGAARWSAALLGGATLLMAAGRLATVV